MRLVVFLASRNNKILIQTSQQITFQQIPAPEQQQNQSCKLFLRSNMPTTPFSKKITFFHPHYCFKKWAGHKYQHYFIIFKKVILKKITKISKLKKITNK